MDCTVFGVRPAKGGWMVEQGAQRTGPYLSYELATKVALGQARAAVRCGGGARVSVTDTAGQTLAEVCVCREFRRVAAACCAAARAN